MNLRIKILTLVGLVLGIVAVLAIAAQRVLPRARVTARVVDEQGMPIPNVSVAFVFGRANNAGAIVKVEGLTNSEGLFAGEGYSDGGYGVTISKEGFYRSGLGAPKLIDIVDGRWQPWDPVATTVLRKVGNPVPLYAMRMQGDVPALDQPCGYDLEKGDWVKPHGKGEKADFMITTRRHYRAWMDFTAEAEIIFSEPKDGILQVEHPPEGKYSIFKWDRLAPENGYNGRHVIRIADTGGRFERSYDSNRRDRGYFFRVRTLEKEGRIVAANYGKIAGDIGIDPRGSKTCSINFTYYFNPTSLDRNLEWDTKRNLLQGLSYDQTPREP